MSGFMLFLVAVFALLWLPTGTPEDIFTTGAIIRTIGLVPYLIISLVFVGVLLYFGIYTQIIREERRTYKKSSRKFRGVSMRVVKKIGGKGG